MKNRKRKEPAPMPPHQVNEIVEAETYRYSCDERAEIALRAEVAEIARKISPDEMRQLATMFALGCEEEIRRIPGHPSLPLLDAWYARQKGS